MQALPLCLPQFNDIKRFRNNKLDVDCIAKLMPGEYYVTRHNEVLTTVLGSCISVCVYDAKKPIGGMNHFMLPSDAAGSNIDSRTLSDSTRYGNYAMEMLINDILYNGGSRSDLRFKVFGGGNIMDARFDVGEQNIAFIRSFIANEGYRIESEDVGSNCPRLINFYPLTGRVKVKRLSQAASSKVIEAERSIDTRIKPPSNCGDLELF